MSLPDRVVLLALSKLTPTTRVKLTAGLVSKAVTASTLETRADLFRRIAHRGENYPVTKRSDEVHTAGLYWAVDSVAGVDGEIVECGVGLGRSLLALSRAAEISCPGKRVLGFDSFAGFPDAVQQDLSPRVTALGRPPTGWTDTSESFVSSALDAPAELFAGFFEKTLPGNVPAKIALLHVDCDMYESTRVVLEHCLSLVQPGGLIVLDEYLDPTWPGATQAVDEALGPLGLEPTWEPRLLRYIVRVPISGTAG